MPFHVADAAWSDLALVGAAAFLSSILGGLSGYGVGLILPVFLAPVVGVAGVVPVMSVAMGITNGSRALVFRRDVAVWAWASALALGLPCALIGAYVYTLLSTRMIAALVGGFLIMSVPLRQFLERRRYRIAVRGVVAAGAGYGLLAGGMTGTGLLLISALMAAGVQGAAVIGTDASVSVVINVAKGAVFGQASLLDAEFVVLGLMIGLCTAPGAVVARWLLTRIPMHIHTVFMDCMVALGGALFVVQGFL